MRNVASTELEFSKKYDKAHSENYFRKHRSSLGRQVSNWREQAIARKSLRVAQHPKVVLDIPCGAGRFWPMLAEDPSRQLFAADYSKDMLEIAKSVHPDQLAERFKTFQTSAFDIDLPDNSVDNIFCMRLLHHIGNPEDRLALLNEFQRVTRHSVCISLWLDGNLKARRRRKLETRRANQQKRKYQNRFVIAKRVIEAEFKQTGFDIIGKIDFLKGISMWRIYVLGSNAPNQG